MRFVVMAWVPWRFTTSWTASSTSSTVCRERCCFGSRRVRVLSAVVMLPCCRWSPRRTPTQDHNSDHVSGQLCTRGQPTLTSGDKSRGIRPERCPSKCVRFGSSMSVAEANAHFRFCPLNGHSTGRFSLRKCADSVEEVLGRTSVTMSMGLARCGWVALKPALARGAGSASPASGGSGRRLRGGTRRGRRSALVVGAGRDEGCV